MLRRVNTLVNVGYGEELESETRTKSDSSICEAGSMIQEEYIDRGSSYTDSETWSKTYQGSSLVNHEQSSYFDQSNCDFVNEEMGTLNRKGGKFLNKL